MGEEAVEGDVLDSGREIYANRCQDLVPICKE
jgi:hypothetical protein